MVQKGVEKTGRGGNIDNGYQVEGPKAGAKLTKEDDREEELQKGGGARAGGPPKRHCQGVGRAISDPLSL